MECPKCKSAKVRTYDNEPLYHPSKVDSEKDNYVTGFDNEIYVSFVCDSCNYNGNAVGVITFINLK